MSASQRSTLHNIFKYGGAAAGVLEGPEGVVAGYELGDKIATGIEYVLDFFNPGYEGTTGIPAVTETKNIANLLPIRYNNAIPLAPLSPSMQPIQPPMNLLRADAFNHGVYQRQPVIRVQYGRDNSFTSYAQQGPNAAFGTSGFTQNDGFPIEQKRIIRRKPQARKYKYVI